jgi:hypothetical protein
MKVLLKNYLLLNSIVLFRQNRLTILVWVFLTCSNTWSLAQVINYVNNPSFEIALPSATLSPFDAVKYWGPIDSIGNNALLLQAKSLGKVPHAFGGYQNPKSGDNFIVGQFYCAPSSCGFPLRWYPRNRLKQTLKPNTAYCAKYFVVNTNNCVVGVDNFGIYLGSGILDTIKYCRHPLTYLQPQVEYSSGIITDTLNWVAITGTFTAVGNEKYLVLGNFKSNNLTNTLVINPTFLPNKSNDIYIDDVSLIELNLPAFAGNDTSCIPGTSVYLGRQRDVGIDEACMWFQLPITITPTTAAIDTAAGIWVSPTQTSTYVVKQDICGMIKYDTVVVYKDGVGLKKINLLSENLKIYPIPAKDKLEIFVTLIDLAKEFNKYNIVNSLGEIILEGRLNFSSKSYSIDVSNISSGIYFLQIRGENGLVINKRFIIEK